MIRFLFFPDKCSACGACAVACMDQNDIDPEAGQRPFRRVFCRETAKGIEYISAACLHCVDAPCVEECPMGCLYKDPATGLTLYEREECVGCQACARACPHDAIGFFRRTGDPVARIEKCDGCHIRLEAGLLPACVRACPTGALRLEEE